jgi:hypothetical protein
MWKTLRDKFARDKDFPERTARMQALLRVLDGSMYDDLQFPAHQEYDAQQYIPLRERRPSVRYNLCRLAVEQSVAMLFSEGHFPQVEHGDEATKEALRDILDDARIPSVMVQAACAGSVGSVVLWLRVLSGIVYVDIVPTTYLTPTWQTNRPDLLEKVTEVRKFTGAVLADMGYSIPDDDLKASFWWSREWNDAEETWFLPAKVDDKPLKETRFQRDADRSVTHELGFVPMIWIRNLPGGDSTDGTPSFCDEAIETQIEIEYQMTQAARALRYAGDPTLLIKEPSGSDGKDMVRSASNAIVVDKDGDAKMLEINGSATSAVLEFVRASRDLALEQLHASRVNPDRITVAQSGRAMEILNHPLIWLSDKLRTSYGLYGLQLLLKMIIKVGSQSQLVSRDGDAYPVLKRDKVSLKWPAWYAPTPSDLSSIANTLRTHTDASHMSQETATGIVAALYDVEDVQAEQKRIEADQAKLAAQAPQIKEQITA